MAKKKNKQIIRPWCWYCEREFEDEKVLMQHQKAKHFKCNMCPRRLNTAGGLAVHIQQVHKLEPDNLPRIDNALPGRDGYEVEIFGMEGIPAPDVADYKRRKEIELGLSAGSISQPPAKRPKVENRPLTESELKAQLEAHKALMGAHDTSSSSAPATDGSTGGVYGAGPQTYAAPPAPSPMPPPSAMSPPLGMPPGGPPFFPGGPPPPGAFPGQPPFPPFPGGMPGFPPGPPPPGFPMPPGFPPVGMIPPGALQFPPPPIPIRPPFPPPQLLPPHVSPPFPPPLMAGSPPPPSASPPNPHPNPTSLNQQPPPGTLSMSSQPPAAPPIQGQLVLPNPALRQTLPDLKKKTALKYDDANFSPEEKRGRSSRYYVAAGQDPTAPSADEPRGTKRARAEDFL